MTLGYIQQAWLNGELPYVNIALASSKPGIQGFYFGFTIAFG